MTGFFSKKEIKSTIRYGKDRISCNRCGLFKHVTSPKMKPFGEFRMGIMNIGSFPGETDDLRGKHWQGDSGRLLRKVYSELGINLHKDCININAANCRPKNASGESRPPNNHELDCCRRIVLDAINKYKPKVIILFGVQAVYSVIGNHWHTNLGNIKQWRGWKIPDQEYGTWICPTLDPKNVLGDRQEVMTIFKRDLQAAINVSKKTFPVYVPPEIEYIKDLSALNMIPNVSTISFDYETTGLKPNAKGHKIICASIALNANHVVSFPMPQDIKECRPFLKVMRNPTIKKMAHNMKYEENWTYNIFGVRVKNWWWCSMQAAHILDNRQGISGLKFQSYVIFGLPDYSTEVGPYLKSVDSKNANSQNTLEKYVERPANLRKTLLYCGLDSGLQYRLAEHQMEQFELLTLPF